MRFKSIAGMTAIVGTLATAASAEYPERDIRVVVPWGAGGGTDGIVRKLTDLAEAEIGADMYVENVEGGISATGITQVMEADPDGYTVGALTYDSVVTVPWQGLLPSYDMGNLKLIARVTSEPDAIMVGSGSDYGSIEDLVAAAKADPGNVRIGIQNIGSRTHLAILQLQNETGAEFRIVGYPGGAAPQKEAILSGEVDVVVTSLGDFASLIADGTVRGLLEFSDSPNPTYPDVQTAADAGLDLRIGSFIVLAAPAGTPDEAVASIEAAYKAAMDSEEFQTWVSDIGVTPSWLGSAEVTEWADTTAQQIFGQLDGLVTEGVLTK